jgi:hypothetical protein
VFASAIADYPPSVSWTGASEALEQSLPLGNGDTSLNVAMMRGGMLNIYVAKSDAWSESSKLLKLGLLEIQLSPAPSSSVNITQTLDVSTATHTAELEGFATISVWVDAANLSQPSQSLTSRSRHSPLH